MGKGSSQKVYDYLYSLNYGLCHGVIDSINQIWVKDKPIFCGRASGRTNVNVDLPEVFGGDLKEGGVRGVIEVYPGTETQVASEELASRAGKTPATMPAYRGQAHLFFRGAGSTGFKWGTNNPYLGEIKVSLTAIPRSLGAQYSVIWPLGEDAPENPEAGGADGSLVPTNVSAQGALTAPRITGFAGSAGIPGLTLNTEPEEEIAFVEDPFSAEALLEANGFIPTEDDDLETDGNGDPVYAETSAPTEAEIDAGLVSYTFVTRCTFWISALNDFGTGSIQTAIKFYEGVPDGTGGYVIGPEIVAAGGSASDSGTGPVELTATFSVPPLARFYRVLTIINKVGTATSVEELEQEQSSGWLRLAYAHCSVDGSLGTLPDANPAHIVYECLVNDLYGKNEPVELIDVAAFEAVAEALFNERFGLSMAWYREDKIENFIQEVLDHVKMFLFQDPETGLWTPRLLRHDYVVSELPWLTPENCTVKNPKRRAWGETVNQITVTYTDPATEEEASVTAHSLAGVAVVGKTIPETRNYYGIRNRRLAQTVADRDVKEAGYPLWSATIEVSRSLWRVKPGDVFRLEYPDESIENMVVRVMDVDRGKKTDRAIRLSVVEDIFAAERTRYSEPQESLWEDDRAAPEPLDAQLLVTPPLPFLLLSGASEADVNVYPDTRVAVMGASDTTRVLDIKVRTQVSTEDGLRIRTVAVAPASPSYILPDALVAQEVSLLPRAIIDGLGGGYLRPGTLLMLGEEEATSELCRLGSFSRITQSWNLIRGVYDTTPKAWPPGTRLWVFPDSPEFVDPTERVAGASARYWLLPRTRAGRLSMPRATPEDHTFVARQWLPHRPADCQIDGFGFADAHYTVEPFPASVEATWANRNRLTEDGVPPRWHDDNMTPEPGQTTTIRLRLPDGTLLAEHTGLTGTSHTILRTELDATQEAWVEFIAVRDGLESFQFARRFLKFGGGVIAAPTGLSVPTGMTAPVIFSPNIED